MLQDWDEVLIAQACCTFNSSFLAWKQPPPTQLVTLLMQTPQLYARNAVRTSKNLLCQLQPNLTGRVLYNTLDSFWHL
jgi:hypothetical protein